MCSSKRASNVLRSAVESLTKGKGVVVGVGMGAVGETADPGVGAEGGGGLLNTAGKICISLLSKSTDRHNIFYKSCLTTSLGQRLRLACNFFEISFISAFLGLVAQDSI